MLIFFSWCAFTCLTLYSSVQIPGANLISREVRLINSSHWLNTENRTQWCLKSCSRNEKSLQFSRRQCVHMYSSLVPVKSVVTLCTHFARSNFLAVQMNCPDAQLQKHGVVTVLTFALTLLYNMVIFLKFSLSFVM
jgi:hypothetical protein